MRERTELWLALQRLALLGTHTPTARQYLVDPAVRSREVVYYAARECSEIDEEVRRAAYDRLGLVCTSLRTRYRLHLGVADGMSIARVWACRYSK